MPLLNTATALYLGSTPVAKVYQGSAQVWPAPGPGGITHGSQITTSNTGYTAYFDTTLGRTLVLGDLTEVAGTHWLTDFTAGGTGGTEGSPKILTGYHFTGSVIFDEDWITLRGCLLDNPTTSFQSPTHNVGAVLDYCTVSPATVGDECMSFQSWSANRCHFRGCSDAAKINGGTETITITESHLRVKMASADDHTDTLQNVGGSGTVLIERCNLSVVPEGGVLTGGSGGLDAVVMSADMNAGSTFHLEVTDCLLDGTGCAETLRFYDGALTAAITYQATGNRFIRSASAPLGRGSANTTPTGQIVWSNNVWDDDAEVIPLA